MGETEINSEINLSLTREIGWVQKGQSICKYYFESSVIDTKSFGQYEYKE